MAEHTLRITASPIVMLEIQSLAVAEGAATSEPQPASSTADPLNAPISGGDIQAAAQLITVVFATGAAAAKFIGALLDLKKKWQARIKVSSVEKGVTVVLEDQHDVRKLVEP